MICGPTAGGCDMELLGRFAPTPSGRMHLGNVFTALMAWLSVRSRGGKMLLRIEDLDTMRCPRENEDRLREDMDWLGLDWDMEQPRQSERTAYYEQVLAKLRQTGGVFPCWCTRGDLKNAPNAPHASDGHPIHPASCREASEEERAVHKTPPAWRPGAHLPRRVRATAGAKRIGINLGRNSLPAQNTFRAADCGPQRGLRGAERDPLSNRSPAKRVRFDF